MTDQEIRKLAAEKLIKKHGGEENVFLWEKTPNKDVLNLMIEMYKEAQKEPINVITYLLAEPYGCARCDSGRLRSADRPHFDDCPYLIATNFLSASDLVPCAKEHPELYTGSHCHKCGEVWIIKKSCVHENKNNE